jgi:hypothetical protein
VATLIIAVCLLVIATTATFTNTATVLPLSEQGVTAEINSSYFPLQRAGANVSPSEQGVTAEIGSKYFPLH